MLKAALLDGDAALQSWQAWEAQTDFDEIDSASYRMVPLLYRNLQRLGVEHPLMERMKSVYRHTWYRNQLLSHRTIQLINLFQSEGIPVMVFKGTTLLELYYRDKGLRPMNDFDFMVHPDHFGKAHALLVSNGWQNQFELTDDYRERKHAMSYKQIDGLEVDLHCGLRKDLLHLNERIWSAAKPLELGKCTTLTMGQTDMLFHTLIHGIRRNRILPIRWICDAWYLLKNQQEPIDWERFTQMVLTSNRVLACREALHYLRLHWGIEFPETVTCALEQAPINHVDFKFFQRELGTWKAAGRYEQAYADFLIERQPANRCAACIQFLAYIKQRWSMTFWQKHCELWPVTALRHAWRHYSTVK